MKLLVALESHFISCRSEVYSQNLTYEGIWSRYRAVFEEVLVVARTQEVSQVPPGLRKTTGPGVSIWPVPDFHGPWQYLRKRGEVRAAIDRAVDQCDAYMLRVPGTVGAEVWARLKKLGRPYGVEVVGDPWLSLAPGSLKSVARPLARWMFSRDLKQQCRGALTALYVTMQALQRDYPPGANTCAIGCSDVELDNVIAEEDLLSRWKRARELPARLAGAGAPVRLGFIGTLAQLYKAPDIHIQALAKCVRQGANVELAMVGGGAYLEEMRALAQQLGVADRVLLLGSLPGGQPIFDFLDSVDLFLNASRQEGLPRALVEAMSRGCPAIGSDLAGLPELLQPDCLVPVDDADALAHVILELLRNPQRLAGGIRHSVDTASQYLRSVLDPRREAHYAELRRRTAELTRPQ
jgi:glycosyltransferase involved in cell wall biosynthesis